MIRNIPGQTFVCPNCGAEISVILGGDGEMIPVCCGRPMVRLGKIKKIYYCPTCGVQIMVLKSGSENLAPVCCHVPMREMVFSQTA